jgi:hypothetical protein
VKRASSTLYHRAIAIHGEADTVLPPGIPHPALPPGIPLSVANSFLSKAYGPGSKVPVWMLAHIADTERDEDEGKPAVKLV